MYLRQVIVAWTKLQFFHKNLFKILVAGLKVLMTFMNDLQSKAIVKQFIVFYG